MSLSRQSIALILTTKNNQTQHYVHQKHKRKSEKTAVANKAIYTLIWYAFFDLRSGNGVGESYSPGARTGLPSSEVMEMFTMLLLQLYVVLLFDSYVDGKTECCYYSLTWTFCFPRARDTVYFAHCYPYTYSDLQVSYQHCFN